MIIIQSLLSTIPKFPCEQELASIKNEGVPTDAKVELIFAPIVPLLPTP